MKTPAEIAAEAMDSFTIIDGDVLEFSAEYIREQIRAAVYVDRAQSEIKSEPMVHIRCGARVSDLNVTPGYFAVCPKCDEDLYSFEVRPGAQREFTERELDELLSEWDALSGDVDGFYQKWTAKINREVA